jgi:hypothetical protein
VSTRLINSSKKVTSAVDPYFFQTYEEVENWLNDFEIKHFEINPKTLEVTVNSSLFLTNASLHKIPVQFKEVLGIADFSNNQLTSLKGCPKVVEESFNCNANDLTSLEYGPEQVGGSFFCAGNRLIDLKGMPTKIGGDLLVSRNRLSSLEGCPKTIPGNFSCNSNMLRSLQEGPSHVGGHYDCSYNRLSSLEG